MNSCTTTSNMNINNNIYTDEYIYTDIKNNCNELISRLRYSTIRGIIYSNDIEENIINIYEKINNLNKNMEELCDNIDTYSALQGFITKNDKNNKISIRINNKEIESNQNIKLY
jgi:hypothetical protein